jgi:hypothetical protein
MEKEKKKREVWWLLWGIFTAFAIQVIYDGFGLYFGSYIQYLVGLIISFSVLAVLAGYAVLITHKKG